jgi:hypothetical protein
VSRYIPFNLQKEGYIHNWLVAGPQAVSVPDVERSAGENAKLQIARRYHEPGSGVPQTPQEWEPPFSIGDETFHWRYMRCLDDHLIDLSDSYSSCHYLRAWAYVEVKCPQAQQVTFVLTTHGPADVWLDDQHIHRQEQFTGQARYSLRFPAMLHKGQNKILVRFEQVALGECPYAMALQIAGLPSEGVGVMLPTSIKAIKRRQTLEQVIEAAYLDRFVYGKDDEIIVRWPDNLRESVQIGLSFQDDKGWIYKEVIATEGGASTSHHLFRGSDVSEGTYQVFVRPWFQEYYKYNQRVQKAINLHVIKHDYSQRPHDTFDQRRQEALEDAATRSGDLYAEIAKMELGDWSGVGSDVILQAVETVSRRQIGGEVDLISLLGLMHRYLKAPAFPEQLRRPLEECILGYRRWTRHLSDIVCSLSESSPILFYASQILAGQLYPERDLEGEQSGRQMRERGERLALAWMHKRATGGFREWDSSCSFAKTLVALAHLADLAENEDVRDLAALLMDKIFLSMALNSYQGAFGSTHGKAQASALQDPRLEATSGISRLMWGHGILNDQKWGAVSLACCRRYQLPLTIEQIAQSLPEELWNRERHAGQLEAWVDRDTDTWEVNKVTYKTPDYMLCSAQDYRAGEKGDQEHIWQATLGPEAVVFVNHPGAMSEKDSQASNFWRGNHTLPRVAQWRNVLVAIHHLPEDDWLGFTHAYFPLHAFDEHCLRGGWAFACKGEGYLALTAAQGSELVTRGQSAYRELRSYGQRNIWLCTMGRAKLDGSFGEFQERVLKSPVTFEGLQVRCAIPGGEMLSFGWEGPLIVDGQEQPTRGFKHYENPFCVVDWPATKMEVNFGPRSLVLEFSTPPTDVG